MDKPTNEPIPIPGQYVVRFTDDTQLNTVAKGFGLFRVGVPSVESVFDDFEAEEVRPVFPTRVGKSDDLSRFYVVRIPEARDEKQFLDRMTSNPNIMSIEQDIMCRVAAVPDDPSQSSQWWVYQTSRRDIHAREAWDIEQGSDTAVIAIIDTGVLYNHPDLANNIWINPDEDIDGDMVVFDSTDMDGIDDGGNGYTDDLVGYDFVSASSNLWPGEDGSVKDNDPKDFNGHGTHCSGIAAAVTNNSTGGCGVGGGWGHFYADRGVSIMCLRAGYSIDDGGYENGVLVMSAVAEAINYAVDNGAHVISYSAGSSFTSALYTALNRAMNAGIVFCHAAGNDGADLPDYFGTFSGLISVAATTSSDVRWSGSSYGTWVEVAAPGQSIYSTVSNHYSPGYVSYTGTSMACPMAAGLAALIKSAHPQFDKTVIDTLLINRADSINDAQFLAGRLGSGRINAYNSLMDAPSAMFEGSPLSGTAPLNVHFADLSPAATDWSWDFGDGGSSPDQAPSHTYTTPGYHTVTLEVTDPNGVDVQTKKSYIYISADTLYSEPAVFPVGEKVHIPVRMKNNATLDYFMLPFIFPSTGAPSFVFDSFTVAGTRTEDFYIVDKPGQSTNKVVLEFIALTQTGSSTTTGRNGLPPGDGVIVNLWFTASGSGQFTVDTTTFGGSDKVIFSNRFTEFIPVVMPMTGMITAYQRGDSNGDYAVDVGDAVHLINYTFKGGWPPIDYPAVYAGDANADLSIDVGDAVYLINYIFKGGPAPPQ